MVLFGPKFGVPHEEWVLTTIKTKMADNSETSPKEVWLHHKDNPENYSFTLFSMISQTPALLKQN